MTEETIVNRKNPIMSKSTSLYRILSVLLIINFYKSKNGRRKWKGLSLRLIQIYMWGLSGYDNTESLLKMRETGLFTDAPFANNAQVMQILAYCEINGFLTIDKTTKDSVFDLTPKAYVLLISLRDDDLRKEIDDALEHIGVITKTSCEQINIDWADVTY